MTTTMSALGYFWECQHVDQVAGHGIFHDKGYTKPTKERCSYCRGRIIVRRGLWGTFVWTGTGRYRAEDAKATFTSHARAQKAADKAGLVARWIPEADLVKEA